MREDDTEQAEQERALSLDAGATPVERDALRADGPDAASFLQGQLSQEVATLGVGASSWSFLLQPQGKLDAWLRVSRVAPDAFVLDVDGGYGEAVLARLSRFKLRVKCELSPLGWRAIAVRGPNASRPADPADGLVAGFEWSGFPGFDVLGEAPVVAGVRECSPEAFEVERIAAGVPRMGRELDERTIPAETGLVDRAVDFAKGCYTGQELVARINSRGHVNRHLRRLVLPEGAVVPSGAKARTDGKEVGAVTSAAWSASRGTTVALGYVRREIAPGDAVDLLWESGSSMAHVA